MDNGVVKIFEQGKILARAMDNPSYRKNNNELSYDFSTWASEFELAKSEGLMSVSSTLILPNEGIPTYKAIGFLIDSDKVDVRHVSESDSGSSGNERDGDFNANALNLHSLIELSKIIYSKHERLMNEVNINMNDSAYLGLFLNKCTVERPLGIVILAQKFFEKETGIVLPIFIYDSKLGNLEKIDVSENDKVNIIQNMLANKTLQSSKISYFTNKGELVEQDYLADFNLFDKNL